MTRLRDRIIETVAQNLFFTGVIVGTWFLIQEVVTPWIVNSGYVQVTFGG